MASVTQVQAEKFVAAASAGGWSVSIRGTVLTIEKRFQAGSKEEFTACDMDSFGILGLSPQKGGSVWGTDGGSIGGMSALNSGLYRLNKSGSASRFLSAVSAILVRRPVLV